MVASENSPTNQNVLKSTEKKRRTALALVSVIWLYLKLAWNISEVPDECF